MTTRRAFLSALLAIPAVAKLLPCAPKVRLTKDVVPTDGVIENPWADGVTTEVTLTRHKEVYYVLTEINRDTRTITYMRQPRG